MSLNFHGPGDELDRHNLDPNAHGGAFLPAANTAGPRIITPPGAVLAASAATTWYTANAVTFLRFNVPIRKAYRYINLYVGAASGNIQVGVSSVAPSSDTAVNLTRVMHSGVIPCPAAGAVRIDCGETTLDAGDYALFLWCDNTTATFLHGLAAGLTASRLLFSQTRVGGVDTSVLTAGVTTRWVTGLTLESS